MTATSVARFQEGAAGPTPAQLYSWGARALYIGPALGLSAHRNAVAVLALGLDAPFGVANDPAQPAAGYRRCRSVLIPPNTLHHLDAPPGRMAFLYVDAASPDYGQLAAAATDRTARASFDLAAEGALLATVTALADGRRDWPSAREALGTHLKAPRFAAVDPRIRAALDHLHADVGARLSLGALADGAGLSASRFRRLFVAATGVSLKRYRVWIAMGAAVRAIGHGQSLTRAALDAGFSSSAHFSAAYREMFGMEPSRLAKSGLTL